MPAGLIWPGFKTLPRNKIVALATISSDLRGNIFTIDHNGHLHRNKHVKGEREGPLVSPGLGEKIGSGWNGVRSLAAVRFKGATCLAGIGPDGDLVASVAMGKDPRFKAPTKVTVAPPNIRQIFGGHEQLFLVTVDGGLVRQPLSITKGVLTAGQGTEIEPAGWGDGLALFTNGDGTFFEVTFNGTLRYQLATKSTGAPKGNQWIPIATGWSRNHGVFGAGPGGIYAIASEGSLEHHRYATTVDGIVQMSPRGRHTTVGSGLFPWTGLSADIEGFAWPMSVTAGERVDISVGVRLSTPPLGIAAGVADPVHYTVEVHRLRRWHNGQEADFDEVRATEFSGRVFTAARYDPPTEVLATGAGWKSSLTLTVPDVPPDDPGHWRPGVYAAKLIDRSGRAFYAPFIVRPKAPRSPFAILANSNTWNAYNSWGGRGKYTHTYPLPDTLPFKRPHPGLTPDVFWMTPDARFNAFGPSVVMNSCHLLRAELWIQGWLEDLGPTYAFDVYTDQDLHDGKTTIGDGKTPQYKALILNTHPEYWTREMYDRLKAHRDQGGSIIYLGGNGIYEAVELKDDGEHMPIFNGIDLKAFPSYCTNEQLRLNCLMRAPMNGRPEHALLGVGFQNCVQGDAGGQPYNLQQNPGTQHSNPVLAGLTIRKNAELGATSHDVEAPWQTSPASGYHSDGWEVDQRGAGTPPEAFKEESLIASGNTNPDVTGEMLCYTTQFGGVVFAASSINFGGSMIVDPNMQRIVQNALDMCLKR